MARRVLVVGAGIIGLSAAWHALKRGFSVTILERNSPYHEGCSFGNAGMIVPSHFIPLAAPGVVWQGLKWMWNPESPFYIRPRLSWDLLAWGYRFWRASSANRVDAAAPVLRDLHMASRSIYARWAGEPGGAGDNFGLETRGLLMLCQTSRGLDEECRFAERANSLGVPARILDAAAARAMEPGVSMDIEGAVHFPQDCHLDPGRLMKWLLRSCLLMGADVRHGPDVTGFIREGDRIKGVATALGPIEADEFVLAAGSWSSGVARSLDLGLPMQPGKGYSVTLQAPRKVPRLCSILNEARVAVTPMGGRLRVGGTMELSGLNEEIAPARLRGIMRSFCRYYTDFKESDFEGLVPWQGLRPCTPDGLPYVGRSRKNPNLVIATGHAMMGLSLGPVTGKLVGELLDNTPTSMDITLLDPERYG